MSERGRESADETTRPAGDITDLLAAARGGAQGAAQRLFALVYDDLHRMAARHVRSGGRGHGATSLVHEAYLRFAGRTVLPYADRVHFFAVASRAMRQIVIDDARARRAGKRGSGVTAVTLDEEGSPATAASQDLLLIDSVLGAMEREEPRLARIVEWHFFGGLTFAEIAEALQVTERTVLRHWRAARALLHARLAGTAEPAHPLPRR